MFAFWLIAKHLKTVVIYIECDDMGVWRNNRVDITQVLVLQDTNKVAKVSKVQKGTRQVQKMEAFPLKRVYRIHGTDQSFRKVTATIYGELFLFPINPCKCYM